MPAIAPVAAPNIPTPTPSVLDTVNFDARADAVFAAIPATVDGVNAIAANVFHNAQAAEAAADLSLASSIAALAVAGASLWEPGNAYAGGAAAVSPINLQTYRRFAPGGTDAEDPSTSALWEEAGSNKLDKTGGVVSGNLEVAGNLYTGAVMERTYGETGLMTALNPTLGTMQVWNLTGNSSPVNEIPNGGSLTLLIQPTTRVITWPTATWRSSIPVLSSSRYTMVTLWQYGSSLFGSW